MSLNVLGVISRTLRLLGNLEAGGTVGSDDGADCLIAFNSMKRAMFGTIIGPRLSTQTLTGTTGQAENGGLYQIPAGAAFALTAPPNPKNGARFAIADPNLDFATYNVTIGRNGQLINGVAANYVASVSGVTTKLWFRADTGNWIVEADYTALTSAIEFPDELIDYLPYMLAPVISSEFSSTLTPEIIQGATEGREAFARTYGRRGRSTAGPMLGAPQPQTQGAG